MSKFVAGDKMVADDPIKQIIQNIETYAVSEKKYSAQICQELDAIKETVRVDNQRFESKKDEAKAGMDNFKSNHEDIVKVFNHLMAMYKTSKTNSANIVRKKRGEI